MALPAISPTRQPQTTASEEGEAIFSLTGTDLRASSPDTASNAMRALADTLRTRLGPSATKLIAALRQWDIDGEGVVTLKELRVAMRTLQLSVSDAEVLKIFSALDVDNVGRVPISTIQSFLGSGGEVAGRNTELRRERTMPVRAKNKYPTRRHPKPLEEEHAQLFQNVPTWDPVKMRLSADNFLLRSPTKMSRSLTRGFASVSTATLVRPSVAVERQRQIDAKPPLARSMSEASMASRVSRTSTVRGRAGQPSSSVASRTEQIDQFMSKLHDEELIEQQLADRAARLSAQIQEAYEPAANAEASTNIAKRLLAQVKINERRAHELATRANDVQATNKRLRAEVQQLRDNRLAHKLEVDDKVLRIDFLEKEVPKLLENTSHFLHEVDKYNTRKMTTAQEAKGLLGQQAKELVRVDQEIERIDARMEKIENAQYGEEQLRRRKEYYEGKELRAAETAAKTKLGYLTWLSGWWKGEFDQLEHATSYSFDPKCTDGPKSASSSVKKVTNHILELQQQNDSLVSYLQQMTLEAKSLEKELKDLREKKWTLEDRPPNDMSTETMLAEVDAVNERAGHLEQETAALSQPTLAMLELLGPLADRAAAHYRPSGKASEGGSAGIAKLSTRLMTVRGTEEDPDHPERKFAGLEECLEAAGQVVLDLLLSSKQIVKRRELLMKALTRRPSLSSQPSTSEATKAPAPAPASPTSQPGDRAQAPSGGETANAEDATAQAQEGEPRSPNPSKEVVEGEKPAFTAGEMKAPSIVVPGDKEGNETEVAAEELGESSAFKLLAGWTGKTDMPHESVQKVFRHLQMEEHKRKQEERLDEVVSRKHRHGRHGGSSSSVPDSP